MKLLRLVVCVLAVALLGACSVKVHVGVGSHQVNDAATADGRLVRSADLAPADMPQGWTECCPALFLSGTNLHGTSRCVDANVLSTLTAGFERQFALNLAANGDERGHLMAIVRAAKDVAGADRLNAVIVSSAEDPCIVDAVQTDLRSQIDPSAVVDPSSVRAVDRHLPLTGGVRLVTTPFHLNGQDLVQYTDWVTMTAGRLRTTLRFEAIEQASLGEAAWEQAVATSGEPALIQRAAAKLSAAAQ